MNIHQRQQELARRRLTRYERNNTNEAQPNQNNFDAHTNAGSIHNSFEEISTNISTPMRLTIVRQIARSSFQQQIQAGSTHGPVAETSTNISTSMRLTSIRHIARSFLRRQFRTTCNFGTTTYHASQTNEAEPSHVQTHEINIGGEGGVYGEGVDVIGDMDGGIEVEEVIYGG
ncbi:unnamed protein product [Lupinus luteus]|uniref:Uncharacterized protein n=1 Tax=Lupinus luteus TaxID=3873 RepID=A0AAV1VS81_LUPLU